MKTVHIEQKYRAQRMDRVSLLYIRLCLVLGFCCLGMSDTV